MYIMWLPRFSSEHCLKHRASSTGLSSTYGASLCHVLKRHSGPSTRWQIKCCSPNQATLFHCSMFQFWCPHKILSAVGMGQHESTNKQTMMHCVFWPLLSEPAGTFAEPEATVTPLLAETARASLYSLCASMIFVSCSPLVPLWSTLIGTDTADSEQCARASNALL